MKTFSCPSCSSTVFFGNSRCLSCQSEIAFDLYSDAFVNVSDSASPSRKRCANGSLYGACNWAAPISPADALCPSCQLTHTIPEITDPAKLEAWSMIEGEKRRLVYSLHRLDLTLSPQSPENPSGVRFHFLSDSADREVLTGHLAGEITLSTAEADDVERERRRKALHEPYRTLLGHLRHEIGHYFWEQLVAPSALAPFRDLFGDERADYQQALQRHYQNGPRRTAPEQFVSAYASSHPWEDWAETWAHYLHIRDCMHTALHSDLCIGDPRQSPRASLYHSIDLRDFSQILDAWPPLAQLINSFNRSLGTRDPYPFVLSPAVGKKLAFVHNLILDNGKARRDRLA